MIYVNGRFLTQKLSGVQRFAYNILLELSKFSYVTVLVPKGNILYQLPENVILKSVGFGNGHFWEQITLPFFLKKLNNPLLLSLCNTAPYLYNNNIYTLHDLIFKEYPLSYSYLFRKYYNFSSKYHVFNSRHVFTVSKYSKTKILEYFSVSPNNISVIYNAVTTDILNISKKINKDNYSKDRFIMTQAYFDENKNIQVLIDAFKKIDPKFNIYLYLVGSNIIKDQNKFNDLIKLKNVKYIGRVTDCELVSLYSEALCYVIPSKLEGFGIPPLEAQACGCPVISSNTSALPEVVGDSALLFDPESSHELYNKLMEIIVDEDGCTRKSIIDKGYKNYIRFSYYKSANKVYNTIKLFDSEA
ncbi:glycosyltransferase family 4 protein [Acinetobacter sp. NEB149]|uniref:glycosyltransferase family 4 protein n=1 Tax=Acinetobacter sp. NEB149 TaxID=2725684 RepID=UPI001448FA1B|nr:glycosyltransferase family 1 protein [Acinetobacter sp. NEB149]QJB49870.1 glycosyltransferase family 4 protein [Acinetobacter sp. NEB149]